MEKKKLMTIKQFADFTATNPKTLRYYHQIDLLIPEKINESGYRLYCETQIKQLQQILLYRKLGFPLEKIKQLQNQKLDYLTELKQQREQLVIHQEQTTELLATITDLIKKAEVDETPTENFMMKFFKKIKQLITTDFQEADELNFEPTPRVTSFVIKGKQLFSNQRENNILPPYLQNIERKYSLFSKVCIIDEQKISLYQIPFHAQSKLQHLIDLDWQNIKAIEYTIKWHFSHRLYRNYLLNISIMTKEDKKYELKTYVFSVASKLVEIASLYNIEVFDPTNILRFANETNLTLINEHCGEIIEALIESKKISDFEGELLMNERIDLEETFEQLRQKYHEKEVSKETLEYIKKLSNRPLVVHRNGIAYEAAINMQKIKYNKNHYFVTLYINSPEIKYTNNISYMRGGPKNEFVVIYKEE